MVGRWAHLWLLPSSSWLMCHLLKIDWCKKGRGSSKSFNIRFHLQLTLVDSAPWVLGFLVDNCMLPFVFASLVRFPLARLVDTFYVLDGFRICLVKCNIVQFCLLLYTQYMLLLRFRLIGWLFLPFGNTDTCKYASIATFQHCSVFGRKSWDQSVLWSNYWSG